jgi:hypothetical protein
MSIWWYRLVTVPKQMVYFLRDAVRKAVAAQSTANLGTVRELPTASICYQLESLGLSTLLLLYG